MEVWELGGFVGRLVVRLLWLEMFDLCCWIGSLTWWSPRSELRNFFFFLFFSLGGSEMLFPLSFFSYVVWSLTFCGVLLLSLARDLSFRGVCTDQNDLCCILGTGSHRGRWLLPDEKWVHFHSLRIPLSFRSNSSKMSVTSPVRINARTCLVDSHLELW